MVYKKVVFSFIIFLILFTSCNTNEPDSTPANLEFAAEDASCTEAWIKLKAENIKAAQVFREDSLIYTFNTNSIDTTLFDEGLLPNQIYKYHTVIQPSNNSRVITKEVTLQTMDTTSHNFTWQTFTFGGDAGSSVLNDVAIIDENNIWAVGEIYLKDSLGNPDPQAYNAVHWDGQKWEVKRIYFSTICGQLSLTPYPAGSIFCFDDGELWITTTGDKFARLKNNVQIEQFCLPYSLSMSINKIWGASSSNLYVVGNKGGVAHYDGSKWTKIESGTGADIHDVFGAINSSTGETEIYVVASSILYNPERKFIKIVDNKIVYQKDFEYEIFLSSVWSVAGRKIYVTTWNGKIYTFNNNNWKILDYKTEYAQTHIRGTGYNDIFVAGSFGFLTHFNGLSWKVFNSFNYKGYSEVSVKEDIVAVCGNYNGLGIIEIGKRK